MMRDSPPVYLCGDLKICPVLGQVTTAGGATARLGPVNMKVLEALLIRSGSVVSRGELYQAVWRNQVVGEDALTRCISDIRAELRSLSARDDWIETVPKRGYRWLGEVSEMSLAEVATVDRAAGVGPAVGPAVDRAGAGDRAAVAGAARSRSADRSFSAQQRALRLAGRGVAYLVALVVMASLVVWLIDRLSGSPVPVVAVLPVAAGAADRRAAAELDLELAGHFMAFGRVRVLSRSAIESRPANPFPFFYYEFGAQWLIESDLREVAGHSLLTISVADARTGIVEFQVTEAIDGPDSSGVPAAALSSLGRFMDAELAR
jgi:DNA-binding winged helix-turn-helix (wHTH) protein